MSEQQGTILTIHTKDFHLGAPYMPPVTHIVIDDKVYEVAELAAALDWAVEQYRQAKEKGAE